MSRITEQNDILCAVGRDNFEQDTFLAARKSHKPVRNQRKDWTTIGSLHFAYNSNRAVGSEGELRLELEESHTGARLHPELNMAGTKTV